MKSTFPSQNTELLRSLINRKIISVRRQIFDIDLDLENFEQMGDGATEIRFDNEKVLCFVAVTETNSVGIIEDAMPSYGSSYIKLELTDNSFWQQRVNQKLKR